MDLVRWELSGVLQFANIRGNYLIVFNILTTLEIVIFNLRLRVLATLRVAGV